jgi:stage III sporulation protein AE
MRRFVLIMAALLAFTLPTHASEYISEGDTSAYEFDTDAQLDALGRDELMGSVPEQARRGLEDTGLYELSVESLMELSPGEFFGAVWDMLVGQVTQPLRALAGIAGIVLLCALINGIRDAAWDGPLAQVFDAVAIVCVVLSVARPLLDVIDEVTDSVYQGSMFMVSFVPIFSAAMAASGQPATGAAYNMLLFGVCQVVSQVVSRTLLPLLCVYLGLCIAGAIAPGIDISSATATVKDTVTLGLGFVLTLFVALLSLQTMVATGADSAVTKTARFLLGGFVPVVGSVLSEAFHAAQGCLKLIKTSVGAYGIIVTLFTFLPVLLKTVLWYVISNLSVVISDIVGIPAVSALLKAISAALGILVAIALCYALLLILSTTIVMVTGLGV